jgi:hypothetical protein
VATLLAERYMRNGPDAVVCVDTDPVNKTFASYAAFKTRRLELVEKNAVKEKNFDQLMEWIFKEDKHFVIDNGSTSFLPLSRYLALTGALEMIGAAGRKVVMHSVIVGGQALLDTLHEFDQLASSMPASIDLVVWLNEFFGPVATPEGKTFDQMKVYEKNKERISCLVTLAEPPSDMLREDLRALTSRRLAFSEVNEHPEFPLMSKQRLAQTGRAIFEQLERVV